MTFLRWRTRSALRKNPGLRTSTPYAGSHAVGVVFSVEDRQKHEDIKEFVRLLQHDGKAVQVLEFLPKKKENPEFMYDFYSAQDVNIWGRIVNPHFERFIKTSFDYLFYIDTDHHPLVLHLLAGSMAHCRIGRYQEGNEPYFEFMIQSNGTLKGLMENMYKYTKQLK